MIVGVVFCPHPPALLPDLGRGLQPELTLVRDAAYQAVHRINTFLPDKIVLIGSAARSGFIASVPRGNLLGYGRRDLVDSGGRPVGVVTPDAIALPHAIGVRLLEQALGAGRPSVGIAIGPDFASSPTAAQLADLAVGPTSVALLVLGDGSARRGERAPGHLDSRAAAFDDVVFAALRAGDPVALSNLDAELGAQLLAAGVPAWIALGTLLTGHRWQAEVLYAGDPFGVQYYVAIWTPA